MSGERLNSRTLPLSSHDTGEASSRQSQAETPDTNQRLVAPPKGWDALASRVQFNEQVRRQEEIRSEHSTARALPRVQTSTLALPVRAMSSAPAAHRLMQGKTSTAKGSTIQLSSDEEHSSKNSRAGLGHSSSEEEKKPIQQQRLGPSLQSYHDRGSTESALERRQQQRSMRAQQQIKANQLVRRAGAQPAILTTSMAKEHTVPLTAGVVSQGVRIFERTGWSDARYFSVKSVDHTELNRPAVLDQVHALGQKPTSNFVHAYVYRNHYYFPRGGDPSTARRAGDVLMVDTKNNIVVAYAKNGMILTARSQPGVDGLRYLTDQSLLDRGRTPRESERNT